MYTVCFCLDTDTCNIIQSTDLLLESREVEIFSKTNKDKIETDKEYVTSV